MIEEEVPAALAGERLDRVVALVADISRSDASAVIKAAGVNVNGSVASSGKLRLSLGDVVSVDEALIPSPEPPSPDPTVAFEVLYEDDDIIVVDKPAGIVVHPGAGRTTGTLINGLLSRFPELIGVGESFRPGIVHRLDQGTSGLLVIARNADSYRRLVEMLAGHEVERRYIVLVWGHPDASSFTIDAPIGRDPLHPLKMAVVPAGRDARTHVEVLETLSDPDMAVLECRLETGRTHQIRVHLKAVGHPVVGDPIYGGGRGVSLDRPFLHAAGLEFRHPLTGAELRFQSPLPEYLSNFLAGLKRVS